MALNPAAAKAGQAMLNALPLPNICGHSGRRRLGLHSWTPSSPPSNTSATTTGASTRRIRAATTPFRVDYNVTSKLNTWVRYINDYDLDTTGGSFGLEELPGHSSRPSPSITRIPGHGYGVGITYTISPTMVNEFTFGKSYNTWDYYAHDQSQLDRSTMGNPPSFNNFATDPKFLADQNKARPGLSPGSQNFQIGIPESQPSAAASCPTRPASPTRAAASAPTPTGTTSTASTTRSARSSGKHNLKAGLYYERTGKVEQNQATGAGSYLGAYNFASSTAMPNNTQDGYANAFLGNFNSYTEGGRIVGNYWYTDVEAFVQDNWRVSRRAPSPACRRRCAPAPSRRSAWCARSRPPARRPCCSPESPRWCRGR